MYLGIDTSNYTTSVSLYDAGSGSVVQSKKLLPVREGELGLRQSDAVFSHVKQLSEVMTDAIGDRNISIEAIGVSTRPRDIDGSYMPCFMVGRMAAECISKVLGVPLYEFSHQQGHIMAALYSAGRIDLSQENFIAFHLSGGTTEALLVSPSESRIIEAKEIACSLDLKAGQAVDRVGGMLGLPFPSGKYLEELALQSKAKFRIKPTMKGCDCCLSGIENKCSKMLKDGSPREDVALYCLKSIEAALCAMTESLNEKYGNLPLVYAGGVMSNSIIKSAITSKFGGIFAEPAYSSDNASGIAILASAADRK